MADDQKSSTPTPSESGTAAGPPAPQPAAAASSVTPNPQEPWKNFAAKIGEQYDADVVLFSGEIEDSGADELIRIAKKKNRRKNVFLVLTTRGGSADAAFRMARCLQTHYSKLILYIHGMCKSAGTLVAIGVDEIVLSDFGEFGPLDVQLGKKDELWESTSGLDVTQALTSLNLRTYTYFKDSLVAIREGTRGQISTKLAAEIATKLATGVYSNIYSQIDPVQLGAIERAMLIAVQYGHHLADARNNIEEGAVERLATAYPSHSFVIDLEEAKKLFKNVRQPSDLEEQLGECMYILTRDETEDSVVELINEALQPLPQTEKTSEIDETPGEDPEGKRTEGGANNGASRETTYREKPVSIPEAGVAG